jgi:hypothetical protein
MTSCVRVLLAIVAIVFLVQAPTGAHAATPDETARFLAGLPIAAESELASLSQDRGWRQHSEVMNKTWSDLERRQLSPIRAWSKANLTSRRPVTFYFFSGPDFLYVDAFYPNSDVYVLAGLEPIGTLPDVEKLRPGTQATEYGKLRTSLRSLLNLSYFITREMDQDLRNSQLRGTLPILYVFLARAGKTIHDVSYVSLDSDGNEQPDTEDKGVTRGVKIIFSAPGAKRQTLYYFRTDLSNRGIAGNGSFLAFCQKLGIGDVFIKAASYLLHGAAFSTTRDFLLERGASIVQDDTGIPLRYLEQRKWGLHPFGEYVGPIPIFRGHYQRSLEVLFDTRGAPPIDFGVGYRWRPNQSHVLLAVNRDVPEAPAAAPYTDPDPAGPHVGRAMERQAASPKGESAAARGVAGEGGKAPALQDTATERKVESAAKTQPATAVKTADARDAAPAATAVKPAETDLKPAAGARPAVEKAMPSQPVMQAPAAAQVPVAPPDAKGPISLTWLFVQALMIGALIWGVLVIFGNRGGAAGQSS